MSLVQFRPSAPRKQRLEFTSILECSRCRDTRAICGIAPIHEYERPMYDPDGNLYEFETVTDTELFLRFAMPAPINRGRVKQLSNRLRTFHVVRLLRHRKIVTGFYAQESPRTLVAKAFLRSMPRK